MRNFSVKDIERLDIIDEFFDDVDKLDIAVVYFSEAGAMGMPGELKIYLPLDGGVTCCKGNFLRGDFDANKLVKSFSFFNDLAENRPTSGWYHLYGGCGHHWMIQNKYAKRFKELTKGMYAEDIFCDMENFIIKTIYVVFEA